jgi:O-antigen ligase
MKTAVPGTVKLLFLVASITTLLVLPAFTDPVNLPKFIFLVSTSFSLAYFAGIVSIKALRNFNIKQYWPTILRQPITLSLIVFLISIFASSMFSESPLIGFFGLSGRRNGFLTYFTLFVLFLVAYKLASRATLIYFLNVMACIGIFQSVYMLLQFLNFDPIAWDNAYENKMFGTLGNPNFSSAFLAMSFPAIAFCTFSKLYSNKYRVFYGLGMLLNLTALYFAGVYQGPLSLVISLVVVLLIYVLKNSQSRKIKVLSYCIFLFSGVIFVLGVLSIGPLKSIFLKSSFQLRASGYWPPAVELGLNHPFLGVGHEQFVNYFPSVVTLESRLRFGQMIPDNAHNFLLNFFAEGGFLVALAYLSFLVLVSLALIRIYFRSNSEDSYLVLASIGIWTAFIGQSLVSIDNMGISAWIWILAGLIASMKHKAMLLDSDLIPKTRNVPNLVELNKLGKSKPKVVIAMTICFGIVLVFNQQILLDNKVWVLENARKMPEVSSVTESDLRVLLDRSKKWSIDPILLSRASSLLLTYGVTEEGFALLDRTISLNPASPSLHNLKAAAVEAIIGRASAVPIRVREQEMDPWNAASSLELIRDLVDQKNLVAAKKELSRLETFADSSFIVVAKSLFPTRAEMRN